MTKGLENIGNVNKEFKNTTRYVQPLGFLVTPELILKKYDMYTKKPSSRQAIKSMNDFLIDEIEHNRISPKIGLGFTILSKDMLNVVRWDDKYPIVAVNNLYEFSEEDRNNMKPTPLSVDNVGAYCVWELGIVNHERKAWIKFLNSKRKYQDKMDYLNNMLMGGNLK